MAGVYQLGLNNEHDPQDILLGRLKKKTAGVIPPKLPTIQPLLFAAHVLANVS